jgi:hypothetical protein
LSSGFLKYANTAIVLRLLRTVVEQKASHKKASHETN